MKSDDVFFGLSCLSQRRNQKASDIAEIKARKHHSASHDEDELMSDHEHEDRVARGPGVSEEPESEEGVDDSQAEEDRIRRKEAKRLELRRNHEDHFRSASSSKHHYYHYHHQKSRSVPFISTNTPSSGSGQRYPTAVTAPPSPSAYRHHHHHHHNHQQQQHEGRSSGGGASQNRTAVRPWDDEELDAEGDLDAEADYLDDERLRPPPRSMNRSTPRRPWPIGLADLDSPSGR